MSKIFDESRGILYEQSDVLIVKYVAEAMALGRQLSEDELIDLLERFGAEYETLVLEHNSRCLVSGLTEKWEKEGGKEYAEKKAETWLQRIQAAKEDTDE